MSKIDFEKVVAVETVNPSTKRRIPYNERYIQRMRTPLYGNPILMAMKEAMRQAHQPKKIIVNL